MLESKLATDRTVAIGKLESFPDRKNEWLPLLLDRLNDDDTEVRKAAVVEIAELKDRSATPQLIPLLHDRSSDVRDEVLKTFRILRDTSVAGALISSANQEDDPEMKIELLETALGFGDEKAIPLLIGIVESGGLFGGDAFDALQRHLEPRLKSGDVASLKKWWRENESRVVFDASTKRLRLK
jgi:hypothetical protein